MKKEGILIILLIGLAIFAIAFNEYETKDKTPNLEFSIGEECDSSEEAYLPPVSGISSQKWTDYSTLVVKGFVKTFCGGAEITGNFSIDGNDLILKYGISIGNPVTSCICIHQVTYKISNLEHNDYSVSLISE